MANVKFFRLGLNGGVSNASYLEYTNTTDGRIVFALVKGENDTLEHYIWANGIEYHVADASALLKIEHTLNVLLDGAPVDTSIGKMIQDALDGYELTAENFVKLVDSSNSNVKVSISDSSLVLEADSATTDDVTTKTPVGYVKSGTTIPEGTTLQQLVDMIFTKIRGLEGAQTATVSLTGIPSTKEIGDTINVTLSSAYTDGYWKNEESWGSGKQSYQSSASEYTFTLDGITSTTGVYNNYPVKATNNVRVDATHTGSTVVPKNEAGADLISGSVNDTEHYVPFKSTDVVYKTGSFKGDYRYWIGYTETPAAEITRTIADSDLTIKTGWAGNQVTCVDEYTSPQDTYVTFIVPKGMTLKEVTDSFNNDVVANFTATDVNGLGADSKVYTVYQEFVNAESLKRKNIKLN